MSLKKESCIRSINDLKLELQRLKEGRLTQVPTYRLKKDLNFINGEISLNDIISGYVCETKEQSLIRILSKVEDIFNKLEDILEEVETKENKICGLLYKLGINN